jgi:hypothetical protein
MRAILTITYVLSAGLDLWGIIKTARKSFVVDGGGAEVREPTRWEVDGGLFLLGGGLLLTVAASLLSLWRT